MQANASGSDFITAKFTGTNIVYYDAAIETANGGDVELSGTSLFYADETLTHNGVSGDLTVSGTVEPRVWGGCDLLASSNAVLVDTIAGSLTKSFSTNDADGLWSIGGGAAQIVATLANIKGTNTAYGNGIAFAAENAGCVVVTGLVASAPAAFDLDLANIATTIDDVVTNLQANSDLSNVTAVDSDTVRFLVTPSATTMYLVWDNVLSGLGADVTAVSTPLITNRGGATNITGSSAYLNGELMSALGDDANTAVFVYWGTNDGGTNASAWANTNKWNPAQSPNTFSYQALGLSTNTGYYYRYSATNTYGRFWAPESRVFVTSVLTLQATDAWAAEDTGNTGTFKLSRAAAATNGDLIVSVSLTGSALNGTDYAALSTTVTLSNGIDAVFLTVDPVNDGTPEAGGETVIATLLSGDYNIGTPSVATVTVADVDLQVTNLPVTQINGSLATLPGQVVSTGEGPNPEVYVCWGNEPGGTDTGAWDSVEYLGTGYGAGAGFTTNVTVGGSGVYYFRCYVTNATGFDWADTNETFTLSNVWIVATDATADEDGSGDGEFTIYRAADATNGDLTVYYTVHGDSTAVEGTDFVTLSGEVVILTGATSETFAVTAMDDLLFEGTETVKVEITAGPYVIGAQSNAIVTIQDDEGVTDEYYSRMKITFSGYDPPGGPDDTLTNFPALVKLSTNLTGFSYSQFEDPSGGGDLRFSSADGTTALPYEIETWSNAADGVSYVWVRVPALSSPTDYIWAYWGNAAATTPPAYTTNGTTWANGYEGVYHLNESVDDESSGQSHYDSTANEYHSTSQTGNDDVPALVASGQEFDGGGDTIVFGGHVQTSAVLSVMFWTKPTSVANPYYHSLGAVNDWGSFNFHCWNGNGTVYCGIQSKSFAAGTLVAGVWQHFEFTAQGGTGNFYKNGSLVESYGGQTPSDGSWGGLRIHSDTYAVVDEVRVSFVKRSADWVWAEWMNMSSNTVFCDYGIVQAGVYVDNLAATNISGSGATLRGQMLAIGLAENPDVYICWDTTDKGTSSTGDWTNVEYIGNTYGIGDTFSHVIAGSLSTNQAYAYRCYATNSAGNDWADTAEGFITGEVYIQASSDASESGPVPGTFTVFRASSATGTALTVNYTVHGDSTATEGADFSALAGSVTIPAGQTNAVIVINPVADYVYEVPAETVKVEVTAGSYIIGSSSNASITISDTSWSYNDENTGNWNANNTWATSDPLAYPKAGDDATVDSDTVTVTGNQNVRSLTCGGGALTVGTGASLTLFGTNSSWSAGTLTISGALTNNGDFVYTGNNLSLYGDGAFVQQGGGTFYHRSSGYIILHSSGATRGKIDVEGSGTTFRFETAGTGIRAYQAGSRLQISDGATLETDLPNTNDTVTVYDGGSFELLDSSIDVQKGILKLDTAQGLLTNSTITVSSNGTLQADTGATWADVTINGDGRFWVSGGTTVGAGGILVDLATNGPGVLWSAGSIVAAADITNNANTHYTGASLYYDGPGTFIQQNGTTFRHSGANLHFDDNATLNISGAGSRYLFDTANGNFYMTKATAMLRISDGAGMEIDLPQTNDTVYISNNGRFELLGGTIDILKGKLNLTLPSGILSNATVTISSNGTLYTTSPATWEDMTIAGDGLMQIAGTLNIGNGGMTINLATNGPGVVWSAGSIAAIGDITNNANTHYTGASLYYDGPGMFIQQNGTTFRHSGANLHFDDNATLNITGAGSRYLFDTANGNFYMTKATATLRISDGAGMEIDLPQTNDTVYISNNGTFELDNGTVNVNKGILTLSQPYFGGAGGTINVASNGTVRFSGNAAWTNITVTGLGSANLYAGTFTVGSGAPVYLNLDTNGAGVTWGNASINLDNDLICRSEMHCNSTADRNDYGPGALVIQDGGRLYHDTGTQKVFYDGLGYEIGDNGRFEFTTHNARLYMNHADAHVHVLSGGTLACDVGTGNKATIYQNGTFDLKSGGTIEVLSGELQINPNSDSQVQVNGAAVAGNLSAGTFRVVDGDGAGGNTSRLDIRSSADFTTIGSAATVILSGPDSILSRYDGGTQLDASLTTLNGTLSLRNQRQMTATAGLTVGATATFEFGLNAPGAGNSMLTVSNDTTFRGTLDVLDSGSMAAGTYVVITNVAGALTTNSFALGTYPAQFDITMNVVTGANGYVELTVVDAVVRVNNSPGATNVTTSAATLRGTIEQLGYLGANPDVYVCWGTNSTMTESTGAWDNVEYIGNTFGAGQTFSTNLDSLAVNTVYYYRCYATNNTGDDWSDDVASFITAGLWVEATTPTVPENGPGTGQFTVYRPIQTTNEDLTVTYTVNGTSTATAGTDYEVLAGSVLMPAGATSAVINVTPVQDLLPEEGNETVNITLTPNGYDLAAQSNATVTITDVIISPDSWRYRMKITFSGYAGSEVLTNFPALVVLSNNAALNFNYSQFESAAGWDLRFADSNETVLLAYEIEEWDTADISYVWVRVPRIESNTDYIWMYWGDPDAATQQPYTTNGTVWSEQYEAVWHMTETSVSDSTANDNDSTGTSGTPTLTQSGCIGPAVAFGAGDQIDASLSPATNLLTVSAWVRHSTLPNALEKYLSLGSGVAEIRHDYAETLHFRLKTGGVDRDLREYATLEAGTWTFVAGTWDGTNQRLYKNGTQVQSATPSGTASNATSAAISDTTYEMNGLLDEMRVSRTARSAAWLQAEYSNQVPNSTFLTYDPARDRGGGAVFRFR